MWNLPHSKFKSDSEEIGNDALSWGWGQCEVYNTPNNEIKPRGYHSEETGNETGKHQGDFSFLIFSKFVAHLIHFPLLKRIISNNSNKEIKLATMPCQSSSRPWKY